MVLVVLIGWRFLIFPPLLVITYEMIRAPKTCPWAVRPLHLIVAMTIGAAGGWTFHVTVPLVSVEVSWHEPIRALLSVAWGVVVLVALNIHIPPVLAASLLPAVMDEVTWRYPVAVLISTTLLVLCFLLNQVIVAWIQPILDRYEARKQDEKKEKDKYTSDSDEEF